MDQYTVIFQDAEKKQFGLIKLRFSDYFEEILEFEVETQDNSEEGEYSRMTTVAWKMLDGFNANKTFYTDLNGLEMARRTQSRFENTTELENDPEEPSAQG